MILKDRVCQFVYTKQDGSSEVRKAVPISLQSCRSGVTVECYDFVRKGIRRFHWQGVSDVQDITEKCVVVDVEDNRYPNCDPLEVYEAYAEKHPEYSVVELNDKVFVVKV